MLQFARPNQARRLRSLASDMRRLVFLDMKDIPALVNGLLPEIPLNATQKVLIRTDPTDKQKVKALEEHILDEAESNDKKMHDDALISEQSLRPPEENEDNIRALATDDLHAEPMQSYDKHQKGDISLENVESSSSVEKRRAALIIADAYRRYIRRSKYPQKPEYSSIMGMHTVSLLIADKLHLPSPQYTLYFLGPLLHVLLYLNRAEGYVFPEKRKLKISRDNASRVPGNHEQADKLNDQITNAK